MKEETLISLIIALSLSAILIAYFVGYDQGNNAGFRNALSGFTKGCGP